MKSSYSRAIVVEGRDDVAAVKLAADALIIPTHGFGITAETWEVLAKANEEKGLIILTDPDYSGEEIRRKLLEKFPDAINAYIAQDDALLDGDIGVENARPEVIAEALEKAVKNSQDKEASLEGYIEVTMNDLVRFNLAGTDGSSARRKLLCKKLGIGYGNSKALLNKLAHWKIGIKELEQTIKEI